MGVKLKQQVRPNDMRQDLSTGTRSHGSEGGRARQRAWELVHFWSITCLVCHKRGKKRHQKRMRCVTAF